MYDFDWLAAYFDSLVPGWGVGLAGLAVIVGTVIVIGIVKVAWRSIFGK